MTLGVRQNLTRETYWWENEDGLGRIDVAILFKWGIPGLFFVFSNKNYNFHNKYMRKNVNPIYAAGIQTHKLPRHESPPITTRPGLLPYVDIYVLSTWCSEDAFKWMPLTTDDFSVKAFRTVDVNK